MKKALMQVLMYVCLMLPLGACSSDTPQEPEGGTTAPEYFSGVWITSSASQVLDSKENIKKAVDVCEEYGINHIFVVVWNNGRTLYPSRIMKDLIGVEMMEKYQGRDPLREIIDEAHAHNINMRGLSMDLQHRMDRMEG